MKKNYLVLAIAVLFLASCNSKETKYKPIETPISTAEGAHNPHNQKEDPNKPFYQGVILERLDAKAYTYLKIEEVIKGHTHKEGEDHNHEFWIAVTKSPANVGDEVRFQEELRTKKFKSEILNRTFEDLMFASNLQYRVK